MEFAHLDEPFIAMQIPDALAGKIHGILKTEALVMQVCSSALERQGEWIAPVCASRRV
jgi:hypothetical protein